MIFLKADELKCSVECRNCIPPGHKLVSTTVTNNCTIIIFCSAYTTSSLPLAFEVAVANMSCLGPVTTRSQQEPWLQHFVYCTHRLKIFASIDSNIIALFFSGVGGRKDRVKVAGSLQVRCQRPCWRRCWHVDDRSRSSTARHSYKAGIRR